MSDLDLINGLSKSVGISGTVTTASTVSGTSAGDDSIQHTDTRKQSSAKVCCSKQATAIPAGSFIWGPPEWVEEWDSALVVVSGNGVTLGTGAGLAVNAQIMGFRDSVVGGLIWGQHPQFAQQNVAAAAGTGVLASFVLPSPIGVRIRFGFTCTTAFTGGAGTFSVELHRKR